MTTELKVPELGESVVEATISVWHKNVGDLVSAGDVIVELETDKISLDVEADGDGVISELKYEEGDDVNVGDVIALIDERGDGAAAPDGEVQAEEAPAEEPQAEARAEEPAQAAPEPSRDGEERATPVARRMAADQGIELAAVTGTGSGGRVTKQDVEAHLRDREQEAAQVEPPQPAEPAPTAGEEPDKPFFSDGREVERVKMSRRRRTIARRLVEAQQTAAMLTTFNEIDMHNVMDLRRRRKAQFEEATGARLGFMSFFVKASVGALKAFPRINAEIEEDYMLIKHFYDIGIAVSAEEGLVVPVLRDADRKSFAQIENEIRTYARQARDGKLALEDLVGGTFTITNGGVFGSMLSTPILNAPQVGILGMHNIVERPVVVDGEIVIRPVMYVALSYDHRIVDGAEAVQFLYKIKDLIEDPERLLLEG